MFCFFCSGFGLPPHLTKPFSLRVRLLLSSLLFVLLCFLLLCFLLSPSPKKVPRTVPRLRKKKKTDCLCFPRATDMPTNTPSRMLIVGCAPKRAYRAVHQNDHTESNPANKKISNDEAGVGGKPPPSTTQIIFLRGLFRKPFLLDRFAFKFRLCLS